MCGPASILGFAGSCLAGAVMQRMDSLVESSQFLIHDVSSMCRVAGRVFSVGASPVDEAPHGAPRELGPVESVLTPNHAVVAA